MNRKVIVRTGVALSAASVVGILAAVASDHFDLRVLFGLALIGFLYWASWRSLTKDANRPLPKDFDSDGGIDWQEKGVNGQVFALSGTMVLLVPDMAVFEADELGQKLEEAGVRFKLEKIEQRIRPELPTYGRGGLSVRMRVWVERLDLETAKPIAGHQLKITP